MTRFQTILHHPFSWTLILALLISACQSEQPENNAAVTVEDNTSPALQALNAAVKNGSNEAAPYLARGEYYYNEKVYDLAEKDLLRALEFDSSRWEALHLLADTYMDNYQSRKALKTMESAARLNPDRTLTLLKLSEYQLILKQYEDALKTLDGILQKDAQNAEAYFMSGMVFRETGDRGRAINSFQRATELDPDNVDAWIILGNLFDEAGNPLAVRYFDNAIRVAPDNPYALHAKAFYLQNHGDPSAAIEMYKTINRTYPDYTDAYLNTGVLYLTLDSLDKAWEHFNVAVNVSPTDPRGYYFRGLIEEQRARYAEAVRDYEQALSLDPDYAEAKEALSLLQVRK